MALVFEDCTRMAEAYKVLNEDIDGLKVGVLKNKYSSPTPMGTFRTLVRMNS